MTRRKSSMAASALINFRHGRGTVAAARAAAVELGRAGAKKAGHQKLSEQGSNGARAYWARMSPEERRVESRRRAAVRKRNRKAYMTALLAKR